MWTVLVKFVFKTVVGRWVTGILVASLLSGAAYKWHTFKEDLIHKGQQVCVQEINKQTVTDLQDALAAEKSAFAELTVRMDAAALANQEARDRRRTLWDQIIKLEKEMEEQRNEDPEYKEWGDTDLPDGVANRLRNQTSADSQSTLRDDRN